MTSCRRVQKRKKTTNTYYTVRSLVMVREPRQRLKSNSIEAIVSLDQAMSHVILVRGWLTTSNDGKRDAQPLQPFQTSNSSRCPLITPSTVARCHSKKRRLLTNEGQRRRKEDVYSRGTSYLPY